MQIHKCTSSNAASIMQLQSNRMQVNPRQKEDQHRNIWGMPNNRKGKNSQDDAPRMWKIMQSQEMEVSSVYTKTPLRML
jgi:hypothetical protein